MRQAKGRPAGAENGVPPKAGPRVRVMLVRETGPAYAEPVLEQITSSSQVWRLLRDEAESWDREKFLTVMLDGKGHVLGIEEVSVGTLTASLVHPRELLKGLILANAASFICVHNHPSGDPTPSPEDSTLTSRLRSAAEMVGIRLTDHVIIGRGRYHSMCDAGQL